MKHKKITGKKILAALVCFTFLSVAIGSKVIERYTEIARLKEMRKIMTDVQENTVDAMIESVELQQRLKEIDEKLKLSKSRTKK
jgi:hypothetical protein